MTVAFRCRFDVWLPRALVTIAAVALIALGLPFWLAVPLAFVSLPGVFRLLDIVASAPVRARNRRVHATECPSCGLSLGVDARWRIARPDYCVECTSCHARCSFDKRGELQRWEPCGGEPA